MSNWKRYDFLDNTGMSDTVASNFGDLEKSSTMILILVILSGTIILFLIFLFWMGSRVHEIGVRLAIGERKGMIVMQMLLEGVLIGGVAFLLATVCAPAISNGTAKYLLGYEVEQQMSKKDAEEGLIGYAGTVIYETEVIGIEANVTEDVILLSACSVLGIIVAAIVLSFVPVAAKKPQEILSSMSQA